MVREKERDLYGAHAPCFGWKHHPGNEWPSLFQSNSVGPHLFALALCPAFLVFGLALAFAGLVRPRPKVVPAGQRSRAMVTVVPVNDGKTTKTMHTLSRKTKVCLS